MSVLEDFRKWLHETQFWKELQPIPDKVAALEKRVAELEEKLNGKWPADVCPRCGARAMRAQHTFGPDGKGLMHQGWACGECQYQEERMIRPK